jgi:hypothetical protein
MRRAKIAATAAGVGLLAMAAGLGRAQPEGTRAEAGGEKRAQPPSPFGHGTGPTDAMKSMAWIEGTWRVTLTYFGPSGPVYTGQAEAVIEPMLGGGFWRERITVPAGSGLMNPMEGVRSFDRYRKVVRVVWFDTVTTLADVFEGEVDGGGGFVASNVKSGTTGIFGGREANMRITQQPGATRDAFTIDWEVSMDGGKAWTKTATYAYERGGK